jgi:hypothetical protein
MMRDVVAAKPGSARAHFAYAEILAHDGKLGQAAEEAKKARTIDPDVKFTDPEKFRAFETSLLREQRPVTRTLPTPSTAIEPTRIAPAQVAPAPSRAQGSGLPGWVWWAGLAVIAFVLWRVFSRDRTAPPAAGMAAGPGYGVPMQGAPSAGYGAGQVGPYNNPGYAPPRAGSGLLGTGLAAAGGVAAGMLAERMLHERQGQSIDPGTGAAGGFFDSPQGGSLANDVESQPIDFGTGDNDWDSGSGDVGGGDIGGGDGGWD